MLAKGLERFSNGGAVELLDQVEKALTLTEIDPPLLIKTDPPDYCQIFTA